MPDQSEQLLLIGRAELFSLQNIKDRLHPSDPECRRNCDGL